MNMIEVITLSLIKYDEKIADDSHLACFHPVYLFGMC